MSMPVYLVSYDINDDPCETCGQDFYTKKIEPLVQKDIAAYVVETSFLIRYKGKADKLRSIFRTKVKNIFLENNKKLVSPRLCLGTHKV